MFIVNYILKNSKGLKHICLRTAQKIAFIHLNTGQYDLIIVDIVNTFWKIAC